MQTLTEYEKLDAIATRLLRQYKEAELIPSFVVSEQVAAAFTEEWPGFLVDMSSAVFEHARELELAKLEYGDDAEAEAALMDHIALFYHPENA